MHPGWARSIRDQCIAGGVPFFFKQWGAWLPDGLIGTLLDKHPKRGVMISVDGKVIDETTVDRVLASAGGHTVFRRDLLDQYQHMSAVGKKAAGRLLDGREWNEYPIQECI
jgi:protein gp37